MTEGALDGFPGDALMTLAQVRMAGFGVALDDVGPEQSAGRNRPGSPSPSSRSTGRSSPHCAARTRRATSSRPSSSSHRLELKGVAEGIETFADLSRVGEMGVDLIQGFFVSRKVDLAELIAMFKEWRKSDIVPKNAQ